MLKFITEIEKNSPAEAGLVYGFLCTLCFFTMQTMAKLFQDTVHYSQIGLIRGLTLLIGIICVAKNQNQPLYTNEKFWSMTLRNILGYQTSLGLYWGVTKIPISQNTMLLQMAPLFVPLCDRIIYKTTYTLKELMLSLVAVLGVYMVLVGKEPINQEYYVQGFEKLKVVIILFFSITMGFSISAVLVKEVKHINPLVINANFALVGMMTSAMLEVYSEKYILSLKDLILIIITVGFVGFFSQHFFIKCFQLAKPGRASLINCLNIIYAFLLEIVFYDEYPNITQITGAIICVTCVIWSLTLRK